MALIPLAEFFVRFREFGNFVLEDKRASVAREAALREQLAAAGLPDDQVETAPVSDEEVLGFMAAYVALNPQVPTEPGEDVLPDVDELPEPPAPEEPVTP
jgi:hypothetical protein